MGWVEATPQFSLLSVAALEETKSAFLCSAKGMQEAPAVVSHFFSAIMDFGSVLAEKFERDTEQQG